MHLLRARSLELERAHRTFWPVYTELFEEKLYVETSSLGARHFEVLSYPDLARLESGDVPRYPIDFPQEICNHSWPSPRAEDRRCAVWPWRSTDGSLLARVITSSGDVLAYLPSRAEGLVCASGWTVVWAQCEQGLEFQLIGEHPRRFLLPEADRACARFCQGKLLIGDSTGRVLEMALAP
ncbi:MAG: hypothetical protein AB7J86_18675 [Vulcanimicrobiota bacterium]